MRSFFAAAVVAAIAYGQDYYYEEPAWYEGLATQNADGTWTLNTGDMPNLPEITFADVDTETIMSWLAEKDDLRNNWNAEFMDAWSQYEAAITEPWNTFVSDAESLIQEGVKLDFQTKDEVLNFVADNTFIGGESLRTLFPGIDQYLAESQIQADTISEMFSLDALTITPTDVATPVVLHTSVWNEETQQWEEKIDMDEKIEAALTDKMISYGFNGDVVAAWLNDTGATWEDLIKQQELERATQAQADIATVADYTKAILDNAVVDLKNTSDQARADLAAQLDVSVTDLKAQLDQQAADTIAQIDSFIAGMYGEVKDFTETPVEFPTEEPMPVVMLNKTKKTVKKSAASTHYYGYGICAAAVVATGVYLVKKQQSKAAAATVNNEELDEEFIQV